MASYVYLPVPTPELLKTAVALEAKLNVHNPGSCHGTRRNNALKGLAKWNNRRGGHGCLAGIGADDTLYVVIHGSGLSGMEKAGADRNAASEVLKRADNIKRPLTAIDDLVDDGPAPEWKTYTAKHLAKTMRKEGLPTSHRLIELLACGGGFTDNAFGRVQELTLAEQQLRVHFDLEIQDALPKHRDALRARVAPRVEATLAPITARHQRMDARPNLKSSFGERFYDALLELGYAGVRVHAYKGDVKPGVVTALDGAAPQAFTIMTSHLANKQTSYHPDQAGLRVTYGYPH